MDEFNLPGLKLYKENALNSYPTIFDRAKFSKTNIKLESLNFEIFNDLALSLWALILGCSEFLS